MKDGDLKSQLERSFDTNVIGPVVLTETLKPLLLNSKNPYSIYVNSLMGSLTTAEDPTSIPYSIPDVAYRASKSALNMLMIQEHKEMSKHGLKVFAVDPGFVRSNIRGKSAEAVSAGGLAGDPEVSGRTILNIIEGGRDADVGKFIHEAGVHPW